MNHSNALNTIRATARLSPQQHVEFSRIAENYAKGADLCINIWNNISKHYRYGFNRSAGVRLSRIFEQELTRLNIDQDDVWIANCALKDNIRQLREHVCFKTQKPEVPTTKTSFRVYRGFDVKVTKGYAYIPSIGTIAIGRFPKFSGRIVATGLEVFEGDMTCVIVYEVSVNLNTVTAC